MNARPGRDADVVAVLCTAPRTPDAGKPTAHELARQLVGERLCACANVIEGVTSWFWWEGKVDRAEECMLVLKTTRGLLPRLQQRFAELHPYAVPEFLAFDVDCGLPAYLGWVAAAVQAPVEPPGGVE